MGKKIASAQDLRSLKEKARADIDLRAGPKDVAITVHMGTCGIAAGARHVVAQLADELAEASAGSVTVRQTGCAGLCDQEPMMTVSDRAGHEFRYGRLDSKKVHQIVREHVLGGHPVARFIIRT
jgi:NADP-reducing hydrogenase subunit HndB